MHNYNITDVIIFPGGIFTHTGIKTAALIYENTEGTKAINFIKADITCTILTKLFTIDSLTINAHINKSWLHSDYIKNTIVPSIKTDSLLMTIGDLCDFSPKSTRSASYGQSEGKYPFFKSSMKINSFTDIPDYTTESIIIGNGGTPNINYSFEFSASNHCYVLTNKVTDIVILKYIYYYILINIEQLEKWYTGIAIKNLSKENLVCYQINIPSLALQTEIIYYLDHIFDIIKYSVEYIAKLETVNKLYIDHQIKLLSPSKMGTLCSIEIGGTPLTKHDEYYTNGTNLWVSIKDLNYDRLYETKKKITDLGVTKSSVKLLPIDTILLSFKLTIGKVAIAGVPLYTNEAIAGINSLDNTIILNKYLYYYLSLIDISGDKSGIIGNGSLNKDKLFNLDIAVPSIEHQNKIISYLDHNETLIKLLKKSIINEEKEAADYLNTIV